MSDYFVGDLVHQPSGEDREVLQHVLRPPLPWRESSKTRCGRVAAELAEGRCIDIDEAHAKVKRLGQQRAAMFLCMTCCNHISDWPKFEDDPVGRMAREFAGSGWGGHRHSDGEFLSRELRTIAVLIEHHREEFDGLMTAQEDGSLTSVAELRQGRRAKEAGREWGRGQR